MFSRTWNLTGLYKHSKNRPVSKTSRRRSAALAIPSSLIPHDFRQSPSQRLRSPKPSEWQWILQAARFKRETLMMLGLDRMMARAETLRQLREVRWKALDFSIRVTIYRSL